MEALAKETEVPLARLQEISFGPYHSRAGSFRGHTLHASVFRRRGGHDYRVCPDCLTESPHHRAIWALSFISVCPIHLKLLVDTCSCGLPLKWWGKSDLTVCGCRTKTKLTHRYAQSVTPDVAAGTKAVFGLLGDRRFEIEAASVRSMQPFVDLDGPQIVDFLYRLGLERMADRGRIFSLERVGELAWDAHVAFNLAIEAVQPWPQGFHAVLEEFCRRNESEPTGSRRATRGGSITKWVGPIRRWAMALGPERGRTIREAIQTFSIG